MTPREFWALVDRAQARERLADVRAGMMPWLYWNAHRGKTPEKPLEEFLPTLWGRRRRNMSGSEILARFRALKNGTSQ